MKEYIVKMTKRNGCTETKLFSNKKKAKSFAFHWVRDGKAFLRGNDLDYGELSAVVFHWNLEPDYTTPESEKVIDMYYN